MAADISHPRKEFPMQRFKCPLILLCLLVALLAGCSGQPTKEPAAEQNPDSSIQQAQSPWEPVTVQTNAQGEPCFSLSPQDYIQRYNALFQADWGQDMLPPLDQWIDYGVGTLSQSGGAVGHHYVSLLDETNYAEPFLSLCVTQDGQRILETVTGLSQKNYDDGPMDLFRQKTLYSLRVFFPTLEEDAFDTLYSRLFQDGSYAESGEEALPSRVFYQDGIACYGILQIGECDEIHIMAVTQDQLDQWAAAGVALVEGIAA